MVMIFTLVTTVQENLSEMVDQIETGRGEKKQKKQKQKRNYLMTLLLPLRIS